MGTLAQSAFVYAFLCAFGLLAVLTGFLGLRSLPLLRRRSVWKTGLETWHCSVGITVAIAAPFAIEGAGPGAVFWGIVGAFGACSIAVAQARLAKRLKVRTSNPARAQLPAHVASVPGRLGRLLRPSYILAALTFVLLIHILLPVAQGEEILRQLVPDLRIADRWMQSFWVMSACLLIVLRIKIRKQIATYCAIGGYSLWIIVCLIGIAAAGSDAIVAVQRILSAAWDLPGGQAGLAAFLGMSLYGITAALLSGEAGLGIDGLHPATKDEFGPARSIFSPILNACVAFGLTGIFLVAHDVPMQPTLDAPEYRYAHTIAYSSKKPVDVVPRADTDEDTEPTGDSGVQDTGTRRDDRNLRATWLPLEREHRRALAPTVMGQAIVLPTQTPLRVGREYDLLFRANPRGYLIGKLTPQGNGLFVNFAWTSLHDVETLRFQSKDVKLGKLAAWDLEVPVRVIRLGSDDSPRGVILVPKDPSVDLQKLASTHRGPYVVLRDITLVGDVRRIESPDPNLGLYHGLLVDREHPANRWQPPLREVVGRLGFRGPYLFGEADHHAPYVLAADSNFSAANGTQLAVHYKTPKRGLEIGEVQLDGSLVTPPWEHLARAQQLVFRHHEHPHQDIYLKTRAHLVDGRLHFRSEDPTFEDLRSLVHHPDYSGPFLMAPDYEFVVEVHDGARLPDLPNVTAQQRGALHNPTTRKSLVALHSDSEAVGGHSEIYRPHPSAIQYTNAEGPYLSQGPASWLRQTFLIHHPGLAWFAVTAMLLLIFAALCTSIERCKTLLDALFGPGSRGGFPIFMVLAVVLGTTLSWPELARSFSGTAALVFSINLVIVALYLPELVQKQRQPKKPTR